VLEADEKEENADAVLGTGPRGCQALGVLRGLLARVLLCFELGRCPVARRLGVLARPTGPLAAPRSTPARGAPRVDEARGEDARRMELRDLQVTVEPTLAIA